MSQEFRITKTLLKDVLVIERQTFSDERGTFQEIWRTNDIATVIKRPVSLIQGNLSVSKPKTLRGLHAEKMDKLVTPLTGLVFCAVADVREDSPTFGMHETFLMDNRTYSTHRKTLFLPDGVANSFCVMGDEDILYLYAVSATYDGRPKLTVIYNDPDLNISWPYPDKELILSADDKKNKTLRELFPHKF